MTQGNVNWRSRIKKEKGPKMKLDTTCSEKEKSTSEVYFIK